MAPSLMSNVSGDISSMVQLLKSPEENSKNHEQLKNMTCNGVTICLQETRLTEDTLTIFPHIKRFAKGSEPVLLQVQDKDDALL